MAFGRLEQVLGHHHAVVRRVIALLADLDGFEESPVRAEDVITAGLSALAGLELLTVGE